MPSAEENENPWRQGYVQQNLIHNVEWPVSRGTKEASKNCQFLKSMIKELYSDTYLSVDWNLTLMVIRMTHFRVEPSKIECRKI